MSMINALKFVQGAVAKKDYQPALTHFRIANGRVMGFNGVIALSSPIDLDMVATPRAIPFVRAIERCEAPTTVMHLTPTGRVSIKSGKFQAYVECIEEGEILDSICPEGVDAELPGEILNAFKTLEPFISTDASKQWANGILLRGCSAYATNNIIISEYWLGKEVPELIIPTAAIRELVRIREEPVGVTLGERSITFHFLEDRWMRSQLLNSSWPGQDTIEMLLSQEGTYQPFPEGFFEAVQTLLPFVEKELEGRIYFKEGRIATSPTGDAGASVEIAGLPSFGAYHYKHLTSLEGVAESIDFSKHPKPCPFRGNRMRGIFQGMVDS